MRCSLAAVAAALLLPAASWGRQEIPHAGSVTEAEFLAVTDADSPAFRALREEAGLARAGALAARTLENPRLAASREAPASATEQVDVTIAWEPPRPGRRRLAIAASDAGVAAAESRHDVERLRILLAMREAFARWALAAARTEILGGFAERLESLASSQRRRAEAGEVSGLDARRMTIAAAGAKAELVRSDAELASARAAAFAWRPDLAPDARPVLPEAPPPPLLLAASHPEVSALEAELAAARLERDLADRVLQLPEIVAGWQRQRSDAGAVAEGPVLGLEWPLPLLDRGRAQRARAEVRIDALEARVDVARQGLSARREGAVAAYTALRAGAVEASIADEAAEPMSTAATASFRLGEATLTDLLETLRSAAAVRLTALEMRGAALEAHRELERLAGVLPGAREQDDERLLERDQDSPGKESDDALDP